MQPNNQINCFRHKLTEEDNTEDESQMTTSMLMTMMQTMPLLFAQMPHNYHYQESPPPPTNLNRKQRRTNFSIDSILNWNPPTVSSCRLEDPDYHQREERQSKNSLIYSWLECTHYATPEYPPKIEPQALESSKVSSSSQPKRKPINRGPRIPFTSSQVIELEAKFHATQYLSSMEVSQLAQRLNLTDTRIRIWFQNRRAREKREHRVGGGGSSTREMSPVKIAKTSGGQP